MCIIILVIKLCSLICTLYGIRRTRWNSTFLKFPYKQLSSLTLRINEDQESCRVKDDGFNSQRSHVHIILNSKAIHGMFGLLVRALGNVEVISLNPA